MRKITVFGLVVLMIIMVAGCSTPASTNNSDSNNPVTTIAEKEYIPDNQILDLYSNPDNYVGKHVILTGKIFNVDKDGNNYGFQMFNDVENMDRNTVVTISGSDLDIEEDDYVKVDGTVIGTYEGTNAMGGTITAPKITADSIEKSSYQDIVAPTEKEIVPKKATINQHGCVVSVKKIEFAENETRVYLQVINNSKDNFSIYSFDSKIIQDGKQYDEQMNYDADYPELQSDIYPGVTSEGVIAYSRIKQEDFQLIITGYSENYNFDFNDYKFNIKVD